VAEGCEDLASLGAWEQPERREIAQSSGSNIFIDSRPIEGWVVLRAEAWFR